MPFVLLKLYSSFLGSKRSMLYCGAMTEFQPIMFNQQTYQNDLQIQNSHRHMILADFFMKFLQDIGPNFTAQVPLPMIVYLS